MAYGILLMLIMKWQALSNLVESFSFEYSKKKLLVNHV